MFLKLDPSKLSISNFGNVNLHENFSWSIYFFKFVFCYGWFKSPLSTLSKESSICEWLSTKVFKLFSLLFYKLSKFFIVQFTKVKYSKDSIFSRGNVFKVQ